MPAQDADRGVEEPPSGVGAGRIRPKRVVSDVRPLMFVAASGIVLMMGVAALAFWRARPAVLRSPLAARSVIEAFMQAASQSDDVRGRALLSRGALAAFERHGVLDVPPVPDAYVGFERVDMTHFRIDRASSPLGLEVAVARGTAHFDDGAVDFEARLVLEAGDTRWRVEWLHFVRAP